MSMIQKHGATQSIQISVGNTAVLVVQAQHQAPTQHQSPTLQAPTQNTRFLEHRRQFIQVLVLDSEMSQNKFHKLTRDLNTIKTENV